MNNSLTQFRQILPVLLPVILAACVSSGQPPRNAAIRPAVGAIKNTAPQNISARNSDESDSAGDALAAAGLFPETDGASESEFTPGFNPAAKRSEADSVVQAAQTQSVPQTDANEITQVASDLLPIPEPKEKPGFLTLADLQNIAMANNPTLPQANAEIEKERGLWQQVGLYPNPTVGYVNSSTSSNGQSQSNGVLVQQTFITAGKLAKAQDVEAYGVQDAQWELEAQRIRVLNDVQLRYYDVLAAQEQIKIASELSGLSQQALDAANMLFKSMQAPKTDVLQAQVQQYQLQVAMKNAQIEYEAAWNKLAVIIGCPSMKPVPLAEPSTDLPEFDLEAEWQRLVEQSPQLKGVQTEVGIARAQWVSAEAAPIPDITVQFVSQYDSIGDYATFNSLVALPLPLFNRNQGGIYNASQEYSRTQLEVQRVSLVLRDQLVASHSSYLLAKNEAEKLRNDILPKLRENLELTITGYRQGEYSYLSVLNAQQSAFEANLAYVNTVTQARRLAVDIEGLQLTGGLNPASIGTAIQEVGTGGRLRAVQARQEQQNASALSNFAPAALR